MNVRLEGTRLGAVTDTEGIYFIHAVDPGIYVLAASIMGYQKQTVKGVKVAADFTTTQDFILKEIAIEVGEVTVTAVRPVVEPDKTTSKYSMDSEEIARVSSVRNSETMMALQAGVDLDDRQSIRGSDTGSSRGREGASQVLFLVDGVPMQQARASGTTGSDNYSGRVFQRVNLSAIQEIAVITSGMEAEYGMAQAGVINIITREGRRDLHGSLYYTWVPPGKKHWGRDLKDHPLWQGRMKWGNSTWENETYTSPGPDGKRDTADDIPGLPAHRWQDYTAVPGHFLEGSFSGPISRNSSFLLTGKYTGEPAIFPAGSNRGMYEYPTSYTGFRASPLTFETTYKVGWDVTDRLKVKAGGLYAYDTNYIGTTRNSSTGIFIPLETSSGGKATYTHNLIYLTLTQWLTRNSFYESKFSWYRDAEESNGPNSASGEGLPEIPPQRDTAGYFITWPGRVSNYTHADFQNFDIKFDLSSQITRGHFIKSGFEVRVDRLNGYWGTMSSSGSPKVEYIANKELDSYVTPIQTAWYIQDKMEFEGLVANVGVRYDRYDIPHKWFPFTAMQQVMPQGESVTRLRYWGERVSMPAKQKWSPRIGVSHPITKSATMHYSFGVFRQPPAPGRIFTVQNRGGQPSKDYNNNSLIDDTEWGNQNNVRGWAAWPEVDYETTTQFEVGTDWNFVSDYVLRAAAYYKSATDQIGRMNPYWWDPNKESYFRASRSFDNAGFQDNKGFELSLQKKFSDNFSFLISYNLQWATTNGVEESRYYVIPDSTYIASGRYWTSWKVNPTTGLEEPVPLTTAQVQALGHRANEKIRSIQNGTALDWDPLKDEPLKPIKHWPDMWAFYEKNASRQAASSVSLPESYWGVQPRREGWGKISFTYTSPHSYGAWLGDVNINLFYQLKGGVIGGGYNLPNETSAKELAGPIDTRTDLAIEKRWPKAFGGVEVAFLVNVLNLFNQKAGPGGNNWYRYGLQTPPIDDPNYSFYRQPQNANVNPKYTGKHTDFSDFTRYTNFPRRIELGLKVVF
ncbi:MAG: hypothetical protein A3F84_01950 [Candidatus Handelsmanbacteria bacterium RIFCSPLOWO2_12_FULL_64_10]|uniref:TonB-dependent receptor plug domain-containing protein n=1 Tax=Handelsmanbacteria sp. (strain RIFCSPLOWO2_12_FULL_64_10) TaxID=1817868 RepID=A0A1F6CA56_HANXR|nr:MAG: hypothetical protein A3F84_01950 [Candidatus Handelsmanbacteria bacterium RIFCSPLOWO2_12_FULL_64_10]